MSTKHFYLLLFIFLLLSVFFMNRLFMPDMGSVSARYQPTSADCAVQGIVTAYHTRQESYGDEDYRREEQLPEFKTYFDLSVDIQDHTYLFEDQEQDEAMQKHRYNCDLKNVEYTFQLPRDQNEWLSEQIADGEEIVGTCLKGEAFFSENDFFSGTWLHSMTILPAENCTTTP